MVDEKFKLGISLSGGGARGIAYIGVLKALGENQFYPGCIAGTSAGSIVGALYAAGKGPDEIMEIVEDSKLWKVVQVGWSFDGLTKLTYLKDRLSEVIGEDSFEALLRKFHVAISNLNTGDAEIISSGALFDVVMASCSIPLVFKPVEINEQMYVDGGLLNNMPVHPIREEVDVLIGVNVMPKEEESENSKLNSFMEISTRCFDLAINSNTIYSAKQVDVLIEPKGILEYNIFNFNKFEEIYRIGYEAGMEAIPVIQEAMREKV